MAWRDLWKPWIFVSSFTGLGIDRSVFNKPKTFHLTVLMLKLWNKERLATATEVLQVNIYCCKYRLARHRTIIIVTFFVQSISSKVKDALDGQPVFIRLKGLVRFLHQPMGFDCNHRGISCVYNFLTLLLFTKKPDCSVSHDGTIL